MSKTTTPIKTPQAVLNLPERMGDRIKLAQSIVNQLTGNPHFTTAPPVSLTTVQQHIDDLRKSDAAAKVRGAGLVAKRKADWEVVKADLKSLLRYVQQIAEATPDKAPEMILSAGMQVKKTPVRTKPDLKVTNGTVSGTVNLVGRGAGSHSSHEWQMSKDQVTWNYLPSSLSAKTTVTGLTYGSTVYFRHRPITTGGPLPWTNPVSILVS